MKKGKLDNKGFVLVETLIVSAFIAGIMAVLYNNFYPLIGEYEKREVYDDIDGKYATYWIKRIIQHNSTDLQENCDLNGLTNCSTSNPEQCYCYFDCSMVDNVSMRNMCNQLLEKVQVKMNGAQPSIYITTYNLENFKEVVDEQGGVTGGLQKYLKFLPNYKVDSLNGAKYRVIVEFNRTRDGNDYLAYSTFEVKK